MRSLSLRWLFVLFVLCLTPTLFAHDITITGTQNFSSLDGSSSDHDGLSNGVFTVSDGNLTVNGTVNCNDGLLGGPCPMTFTVSGNMVLNAGSALYSEDRLGTGSPASITLNVGGNLTLNGASGATPASIVSAAAVLTSVANGGNVTANVSGSTTVNSGATIDVGSFNGQAGKIAINGAGLVSVDGNLYAGPSRSSSGLMGGYLFGGGGLQKGGEIAVKSTTFAEPAVLIGGHANIITQGENNGTGPITVDGCGIEIKGLLAATSRQNTASQVSIRSGKNLTIDSRDLGVAGATLGRNGSIRADGMLTGSAQNRGVDIFAGGSITILGPAPGSSSVYPLSSNAHSLNPFGDGGRIRIIALGDTITASGRVADASAIFTGGEGGNINIASKNTANLNTAQLRAVGQYALPVPGRSGGDITVRSHSGDVIWTNGNGDVRPIGSLSGLTPSQQGTITLTACGTVNTTGTAFPANGVPTGVFPVVTTGACSPAAPSLPAGVAPLITCNTPPVANDTNATTNEDTTVTIFLSGSDADGDSLTFSIVSGPSNGSLGAIIPTGPTTATVNYTPNFNYFGSDSFVYRANDGNGGTDDATASITINPVNDPPTFLAGPTVNVFEDSGPQTIPGWVSSITPGPANEAGQTVTFTVTNDNNALFAVQPSVAPNGTLTFTPAANAFGSATITIVAQDNGGIANGGNDTSAAQMSTINVNAVNDEPSFTAGPNQTVNEDAGPQTVVGWATGISAGPNEGSQTVSFVTSNNNNALFSVQPSVSSSGTLTYTPAANANGVATVTIYAQDNGGTANGGDDTSPSQMFTITVNAVNDAPSFTSGGDVTVLEDSGAYSAAWATGISAGPADESGQTLTFNTSNDNNALFSVQPSVSPSGVLTFTPAANAFGSATVTVTLSDNGGIANGGVDTSAPQMFTITIDTVNDEPSFTAGGDVTVNEDSGAYSAAWATGISAGPNESGQTLTFNVSNDNNGLFSSQPSISPSGVLSFTLAANANGTATVSVYLMDDGGVANGGDDTSPTVTFTITVDAVNDEPSFTPGGNVSVLEDSGAYSAPWATAISAGPANESGQTVTFNVSNNNNALFSVQPSIAPNGTLSFTVAPNAFGSATVSVFLMDDGGTANGGDDTSPTVMFTITVDPVNDAPSFTPGGNVSVNEDSGLYSAAWATAISAGPANEAGQTVSFNVSNNNNALFSVQPSISPAGVLSFTPAPNAFGSATVTVSLSDNGGVANGGVDTSAAVMFTITVNSINDPPTAGTDSFATFGNTEVRVDLSPSGTPHVLLTTGSGTGVLDNDADTVEGDPFAITSVVGCADATAPFDCTFVDGSVLSLNANGTFTFTPGPGTTTASFGYVVTDMPSSGTPASANGVVNIPISEMIWYVNGAAAPGGNGTSIAPFNDFATLDGPGGVGDVDSAGNIIFVHTSTVNDSIGLEANQRLLGQGVGLTVSSYPLVAAGVRPTINGGAANAVSVSGVAGTEIAGLTLNSTSANGIDVTSNVAGPVAGANIHDNVISGAGAEGIDINGGSAAGVVVSITNTPITSTSHGLDVTSTGPVTVGYSNGTILSTAGSGIRMSATVAGNLTVTALSNVTIDGNTPGDGINLGTATFDAIPGGSFDVVSGGAIAIGTSGNPVGGAGLIMTSASGDYGMTSLNAFSSGTNAAVSIGGSGLFTGATGMRITNGGGNAVAVQGTGLGVTNATIGAAGMTFTRIASSGGSATGIILDNTGNVGGLTVSGAGSAGSGGTIANKSGADGATATGNGIYLNNTSNVSLSWMQLNDFQNHGIRGFRVANFSMSNVVINGTNGTSDSFDNYGEGSVMFGDDASALTNGLTGSASVTNSSISGARARNFSVVNTAGVLNRLTITNTTFGLTNAAGVGSSLAVEARNPGTTANVTVTGSTFSGSAGDISNFTGQTGTTMDVVYQTNNITNTHPGNVIGGGGLTFATQGAMTLNVTGNNMRGAHGSAITLFKAAAGTSLSGTIDNNTIGAAGVPDSGSVTGNGIFLTSNGTGAITLAITNNNIRNYSGNGGIFADNTSGTYTVNLTITGNTTAEPGPFAFTGLALTAGAPATTDDIDVCANITGNNFSQGDPSNANDVILGVSTAASSMRLPGYAGTTLANVESFVLANNNVAGTAVVAFVDPPATAANFVGGAACSTP